MTGEGERNRVFHGWLGCYGNKKWSLFSQKSVLVPSVSLKTPHFSLSFSFRFLFHLSPFCFFFSLLSVSRIFLSLPHILALFLSASLSLFRPVLSSSSIPLVPPLSLIICLFNTHLYSILFSVVMAISRGCVGEKERGNVRARESGCFGSDISWAVTLFPVCRFVGREL